MATTKKTNETVLTSTFEKAKKSMDAALAEVKAALVKKDLKKYGESMKKLKDAVKDANTMKRKVEYAKFLNTPNKTPTIAAVEAFYIDKYRIKESEDKDTGAIKEVSVETRKARIDLEEFCAFGELPLEWAKKANELLNLFVLREIDVFSCTPAELAKKSISFTRLVADKQSGKTPDSNRKIIELLQSIIDDLIFIDNGEGKNVYKCTVHDLYFTHDAITKLDAKEKCTIATMNERQFKTVLMSVLAHCLGEAYKVKAAKSKKND